MRSEVESTDVEHARSMLRSLSETRGYVEDVVKWLVYLRKLLKEDVLTYLYEEEFLSAESGRSESEILRSYRHQVSMRQR